MWQPPSLGCTAADAGARCCWRWGHPPALSGCSQWVLAPRQSPGQSTRKGKFFRCTEMMGLFPVPWRPSQHKTSTSPSLGPLQKKRWVRAQFFITKRAYFYTLQLLANEIVLASVIDIIRRMPVFKNEQSFPLSLKPYTTLKCCISEQKAKFYTSEFFFCIFHYSSDWKSILFYNSYDEQKLWNILIDFCSPQHCNISCCHSSGIWIPCVKRLQEEAQVAFS